MKVAILAGGTGGHIFPALALAHALQQQGRQIVWLGAAGGMETKIVPNHKITLRTLPIQNLRGKGVLRYLALPMRLLCATLKARTILKSEKVSLVVGFGGFVAGPGGLAAKTLGIPLLIHEQNAVAGMANRYLAKIARAVMVGFASALPKSPHKIITGNPVREDLCALRDIEYISHPALRVLVVGGSLGAQVFNNALADCLRQAPQLQNKIDLWQQTGIKHFAQTQAKFSQLGLRAKITAFIDDMEQAYLWADLVICRAGALTLAELGLIGKPAVLVPYPDAADDHQTKNTFEAVQMGAAVLLPQKELSPERLTEILLDFTENPEKLRRMAAKMKTLGQPDATQKIIDVCNKFLD